MDKIPLNTTERIVKKEAQGIVIIGIKLAIARLFLGQSRYNKYLYKQVKSISNLSFDLYASQLVECIKLTRKTSEKYRNTYLETESVVSRFPRLKPYYRNISILVKRHRQKCGLIT